jgi:orotidine-5'-phosphate decarboxylase
MSRIVVALDNMTAPQMLDLAKQLSGKVWGFKVNDALLEFGTSIIAQLKPFGKVFADPKLHDIPNTVANGVDRLVLAGADLITVHASGGVDMMWKAMEAGGPRILAVTILTSMTSQDIEAVYGVRDAAFHDDSVRHNMVARFAEMAMGANCWGVVCAAGDLPHVPAHIKTVVPGFRPKGLVAGDDQKNIGGFKEVKNATLVVVGRPITMAHDPVAVVDEFNKNLEDA